MIELDVLSSSDVAADGLPRAWRSRDDRASAPGYADLRRSEFLPGAADADDLQGDPGPSRRSFLKVMGASMALAGLTGCRRPVETILPYARKQPDVTEGIANFYATAMPLAGVVTPLLVESHEGRPTKVEGNPEHPITQGATDAFAQASVLSLYDPDRSRTARGPNGAAGWAAFVEAARTMAAAGGAGMAVLAEPTSSPTVARLRTLLEQRYPGLRWVTWHPTGDDPAAVAFGRAVRPLYRFSQAATVVTLDADVLGAEDRNGVWNSREMAAGRNVDARGAMLRHYAVESAYTTTGGLADHRRRLRASEVAHFAAALGQALGVGGGSPRASQYASDPVLGAIVEDVRAGGPAVFAAGATQPPAVHALCAALNARYGGGAVEYLDASDGAAPVQPVAPQLVELVRAMQGGQVRTLLMLGTNPAYDLPPELGFEAALARVPTSIHLGLYRDETGRRATWHLPRAHYLEQWGDGRAYDGTLSVIQPLIAPLYADARSEIEVLNVLATGQDAPGYGLVRETLQGQLGTEDAWRTALHDGFVPGTAYASAGAPAAAPDLAALPVVDGYEVTIRPCPKVFDGTFSNNAWMQELPEPVTKLTWDAVAVVSPATARALGVDVELSAGKHYADRVRLSVGDQAIELPVWVQPGQADGAIGVALGYGRELETERAIRDRGLLARLADKDTDVYRPGPVANGIGANAARLRRLAALQGGPVEVAPAGGGYLLASTQDHGSLEGRAIVQMATLDEYRAAPAFARQEERFIEETPWEAYPPLWKERNEADEQPFHADALYASEQWGMAIDLNSCSGCNACVVACQSENTIPVVGKDQVSRGREMHWLRMDRYYVGAADEPAQMVMQPMLCQHCENAPCESVCPVAATSHSPDGINEMTYNRCIGTRYCANNCPYKVRRFNFYNWTKTLPVEVQMAQNPNVTVRFRGVMEKCTFCVQRVRRVQQYAHIENRPVRDGEVQTACQQACAANAIVFGNLADPQSRVNEVKRSARNYAVLAELAVKPRTTYLARLRNPNPRLAALEAAPAAEPVAAPGAAAPAAQV